MSLGAQDPSLLSLPVCACLHAVLVGVLGLEEPLPQTAGAVLVRLFSWACILLGVAGECGIEGYGACAALAAARPAGTCSAIFLAASWCTQS